MTISSDAHILVFPFPAQGHIIPLLDLTHQLNLRGLAITILVTPKNLPMLDPLLSKCPSIQTLVLPFPNYPSFPPGVENVKNLSPDSFSAMMHALAALYNPVLDWFRAHHSPPVTILSDYLLGWTYNLACQLNIPRLVFSTSGALTFSVVHTLWRDLPHRSDPTDPNCLISFTALPHRPKYPWSQLSPAYQNYKEGDPVSEFRKASMRANLTSWGIVFNSLNELERAYLEHVRKFLGHDRVWAVGPLLPVGHHDRGGSSSIPVTDVLAWLDKWTDGSVVYVCFGSQVMLNRGQMEALVAGLEKSRVRFVWCVKEKINVHVEEDYGVIPDGFEDRVAGRGLVIRGWAPQVAILGHRSVGAFLTHCGWNSVLEGLVAGVTMLAWPMGADQFMNAKLLVEDMGVGFRVCEDANTFPNPSNFARVLAESVSHSPERIRARQLGDTALAAVNEGGNSFKDLDAMVKELRDIGFKRNEQFYQVSI